MHNVKLKDIAEVYSGLSYRRYLDDGGMECDVVVQRSIKADGIVNISADKEERAGLVIFLGKGRNVGT